ncbi:diacylglycerol kinase [Dorcoceras hygrometricum]|uniref:Diacylglycerol kinase n=1 Tax=Dorcoceras hygrometricum TaxID=472368 RepID=A0A2Z7DBD8_9LAMI|nr:diacylglycerol kinase [Dorcoceras hygrometricum]
MERFVPAVGFDRHQLLRDLVTDLCCSDFVVAAVCGNCSSGAGELRMLSLFYDCNCSIQLLQPCPLVIVVLFLPDFEGERQYRTLISLLGSNSAHVIKVKKSLQRI